MKTLKRFSAVVSAAALLAVAFTGCKNSFAGTDINYGEKELEKTGDEGLGVTVSGNSQQTTISLLTSSITKSNRATIKVRVSNPNGTKVSDSAKDAIKFYNAKDAAKASYSYTHEATALPISKVFAVTETRNSKTFEFEIDASGVTKNKIVVIVDATKCKDKQGTAILNLNDNDKRGEESDSFIDTIDVNVKAGEAALPAPVGNRVESYQKVNLNNFVYDPTVTEKKTAGSPDKQTGVFFVEIVPKAYAKTLAAYDAGTNEVNKELAGKLNSAYKLRIRKPGSSSYEDKALSFTYYTTYKNGTPDIIASSTIGEYISQDITLEYGTHYEIVKTVIDVNDIVPDYGETVFGHKFVTRTSGFGAATQGVTGSANTFVTQPSFIIDNYVSAATSAVTPWDPRSKDSKAIETAQRSYFQTPSYIESDRVFELRLNNSAAEAYRLAFASESNDFFAVLRNNNVEYKLDVNVSYKKNDAHTNDKLDYVRIEIKDKNINIPTGTTPTLYIGNGVKLSANYAYPTEVSFGSYKDAAEGITSGYVALN